MRVFVDIGSHEGQTIEEVVKPRWRFDQIHAIEPMPAQNGILHDRFQKDPRVVIYPFALGFGRGTRPMYGTNRLLEASLYARKNDVDARHVTAVQVISATAFFRQYLPPDTPVVVNLNAEGAEVPVLLSLCDSGELHRIGHMLVSFDCKKVPGMEGFEQIVRNRMAESGFDRYTDVYVGETHQEQIANWLEQVAP